MVLRVTLTWAIALLCAWLIRTFVPSGYGIFTMGKDVGRVFAFNRIGFWLCILIAVGLSIRPVVRAFLQDFPFRVPR